MEEENAKADGYGGRAQYLLGSLGTLIGENLDGLSSLRTFP